MCVYACVRVHISLKYAAHKAYNFYYYYNNCCYVCDLNEACTYTMLTVILSPQLHSSSSDESLSKKQVYKLLIEMIDYIRVL